MYALGFGFFGVQKTLVPWFHAQKDMKTPLRVSVYTVVMNAALNIVALVALPQEWRHVGFAVSTVVCAGAGCALLGFAARRDGGLAALATALPAVLRILLATGAMAAAIWLARPHLRCLGSFLELAAEIALGGAVYIPLAWLLRRRQAHKTR